MDARVDFHFLRILAELIFQYLSDLDAAIINAGFLLHGAQALAPISECNAPVPPKWAALSAGENICVRATAGTDGDVFPPK